MQIKSETGNYYLDINSEQYIVYTLGEKVLTSYHLRDVLDFMEGKVTEQ